MMKMRRGAVEKVIAEGQEFYNNLVAEKPALPYLVPIFIVAWLLERYISSLSNWIPLLVTVWGMLQYGKYRRKQAIEELNRRWVRQFQLNQPSTPPESCEWLNRLWSTVWPNFFEPRIVRRLLKTVQKRIKEKRPKPIQSIEVQDFSLGTAPPTLTNIHWTTEAGVAALNMSFDWVTNEMSILLAAKLAGPLRGKVARIVINSLRIKGDLRLVPILDGTAVLYSFWNTPEVKVGLAFGSGNQTSVPATELPGVSSWLEKLLKDTLIRTLVEPRRRCYALPAVDLKKHAVGGICSVKVLSGKDLKFRPNYVKSNSSGSSHGSQSSSFKVANPFVELQLEDLMRKSQLPKNGGSSPTWNDDAFDMVLHENTGTLYIAVCEAGSVNLGSIGNCQIKMRYVDDDSTIFWASGPEGGIIASRAETCGKEVTMTIPLEPGVCGEITLALVLKEWQFADGSKAVANYTPAAATVHMQQSMLGSLPSVPALTGRKIRVVTVEGRNLAPMDKTGKSDPYLKLHYGKIVRRTKTVNQDLNPVWNQSFIFHEITGEYLKLRCYDADWFGDENLGSARVNLQGLEEGKPKDVWVPLEKIKQGEIKLKIEVLGPDFEYDGSQGDLEETGSLSGRGGVVEIVLVEGKDLIAADWGGTSDPYVSVRYGNTRKRTKVVHKTLAPQWNQTVEFSDDGSPLVLHVKDYNAIMPTSSIGHCEVDYQKLGPNQTLDKWIALQGVSKGEIHIQITRRFPEKEQKRSQPATPPQAPQSNGNVKLQRTAGKVRTLIRKALALAEEEEEQDEIRQMLEELESAEEEREAVASQLQKDRDLLVAKVKELEQAMNGLI